MEVNVVAIDSISVIKTANDSASSKSDSLSIMPHIKSQSAAIPNNDSVISEPDIVDKDAFVKDKLKNDNQNQVGEQSVSSKSMEEAVKRANNKLTKTHCEFSYNEDVNRVSITVYDNETNEVIREIPPEESLKMLQKLWEIAGLMVDEKR